MSKFRSESLPSANLGEAGGAEGDDAAAAASAVQDTVQANAAMAEDLEVAWETLEVARAIFSPIAEGDKDAMVRATLARPCSSETTPPPLGTTQVY